MKSARKATAGFTIIEVMLFLAIAALMMVGIFAAANNGINNQRYSSSVTSLQGYLQDQYNQTANVRNDRPSSQQCTTGGVSTGATQPVVGTSPCSVIGRMIITNSTAKIFTSTPVYATRDVDTALETAGCNTSDLQMFSATCLNLFADTSQATNYTLEWDTAARRTNGAVFGQLTLLLYRSPLSGQIGAMWHSASPQNLANLFSNSNTTPLTVCVDQSGWTTVPRMGVTLDTTTIGTSNAIAKVGSPTC